MRADYLAVILADRFIQLFRPRIRWRGQPPDLEPAKLFQKDISQRASAPRVDYLAEFIHVAQPLELTAQITHKPDGILWHSLTTSPMDFASGAYSIIYYSYFVYMVLYVFNHTVSFQINLSGKGAAR